MKKGTYYIKFGILFLLSLAALTSHYARAELLITPMRIVMEDRDRFAIITLVNTGKELSTYEMGLRYYKMQETGPAYEVTDKSVTEFDLGKHIMFTPRRISLAPGAKQKIRLALRRPSEMPASGDYRVHLEFASVPNDERAKNNKQEDIKKEKKVGAVVDIYVGFSIPVIWRVGTDNVSASIEQISLRKNDAGKPIVDVPVLRKGGPYSILGHLFVFYTGADGKEEKIGEISNAHIFPEVNKRVFEVVTTKPFSTGKIRVLLRHYDKDKNIVYDEKVFPVQ